MVDFAAIEISYNVLLATMPRSCRNPECLLKSQELSSIAFSLFMKDLGDPSWFVTVSTKNSPSEFLFMLSLVWLWKIVGRIKLIFAQSSCSSFM